MALVLAGACFFTAGCWDRREIQERNFVLAVAIDKAEAEGKDSEPLQSFVQPYGKKKYRLSLQLLRIGQSDEGEKGKTYVISNTGESMFEMVRDMLGQSSRSLWFEHIQAIVISEEVVKEDSLGKILDFFIRDAEMRWRIKVYITSGEAKKVIEFSPQNKEPGGMFLGAMVRLHPRSLHIAGTKTDMGYITQSLDNHSATGIPFLQLQDKSLKITGIAMFQDGIFKGHLDEYTVAGIKLIRGTEKSGVISFPCPEHPEKMLVFEIFHHDTRFLPHCEGEQIYFTLDIDMTGNIGEIQGCFNKHQKMDGATLKVMEEAAASAVTACVANAWKVQQEMGVNAVAAEDKLRTHEPACWGNIKADWKERFREIPLVVSVNVTVRNIGEHQ